MYGRTVKRIRQADRGKGRGADYMPYFQIGDVPSRGWSHRFLSWTTGREIHCLSNLEYGYALIADWSPMVVDIREQMPLSVSETMAIARTLGIRHPMQRGKPSVMTTDFLITVRIGDKEVDVARNIKPSEFLQCERVLELAEIERRYHKHYKRDWGIVTEHGISKILVENIKFVHKCRLVRMLRPITASEISRAAEHLIPACMEGNVPLRVLTRQCDDRLSLPRGHSLKIVRHLIAIRQLRVDMTVAIDPAHPLTFLDDQTPSPLVCV